MRKPALFWTKPNDHIRCQLCPQLCSIGEGKVGLCLVRQNRNSELYALSYGRVSSKSLDPIEKKPFYYFHPGSFIYSIGSLGCNLGCPFCQNWQISHPKDFELEQEPSKIIGQITEEITVEQLVKEALDTKAYGNIGVAFTYNEPLMSFEFLLDACKAIKEKGLFNILVSNGYINPKPFNELVPFIDAMNIDLKGFTEDVYQQLDGHLNPVKKTIQTAAASCHVEVTNLIVPGLNDDKEQIEQMVDWLAEIDTEIPMHFSRYFPAHHYKRESTPVETLKMAKKIANKKLKYVHLGNV